MIDGFTIKDSPNNERIMEDAEKARARGENIACVCQYKLYQCDYCNFSFTVQSSGWDCTTKDEVRRCIATHRAVCKESNNDRKQIIQL